MSRLALSGLLWYERSVVDILLLCTSAFIAGFIDSVAGGGGLVQVPALFVFLPTLPVPILFGTNKLASIAGTSIAATHYARNIAVNWKATLPAVMAAFVFSFLGARVVTLIRPEVMRPLILVLLIAIAIYTFKRKELGSLHAPRLGVTSQTTFSLLTGTVIGFYDGFFGPGTGSFLIFIFVGIFGFSFLSASASSKFVNVTTNLAAVLYFAATDNILYRLALPMAACNMLGSLVGSRLAVLKGSRFVRTFFLLVVSALIIRMAYGIFRAGF
ncbi:MAG: hypothetical protein A4E57_03838 [Syntrophorhabdaceae bacterium PtaU1.Bin034]|nr:MAG: hypothetical protein A4E57_03838 [Syntrophorhabdaceae bacterium PtaU1.Bin034]